MRGEGDTNVLYLKSATFWSAWLWIQSVFFVCCLCVDWLQGGGDLVHVLFGNQLLLDPGGGSVPPQSHLYDLLLGQKVSVGIYSDWMG